MAQFKQFIIFVLMLSSFGMLVQAQSTALFPYEGSTHDYACNGISVGADYEFHITAKTGSVLAGDFDFIGDVSGTIGSDGIATAQIQWNTGSSLNEYEVWLDVTIAGCSNRIFIGVSPQINNRSVGFDLTASTECFNLSDNSFTISFITLDNNGQPLSAAYFPLIVEFDVNGMIQSQLVSFDNQLLSISESMFTANPTQNTDVIVDFTNVTDKYNAPVKPDIVNGTHTRTLFAIPEIEFTQELRELYNLMYEETTAYNGNNTDRVERLEPK
jgi:hypothetical protein